MKNYLLLGFGLTLAACGGGGTTITDNGSGITVLESYGDNVSLVRIAGGTLENEYIGIINEDAAGEVLAGSITGLVVTSSSQDGDWYTVSRNGVMSNGLPISFDTIGVNLNSSGSEYVSRSFVNTNRGGGYTVTGSNLGTLPSGTTSYTGYTEVYDASGTRETGDVTLNVNFGSKSATITGVTDNFIFSSSSIAVNTSSGHFSSSTAEIGQRTGANIRIPATIEGSFYGTNGNGMGGIVTGGLNVVTNSGYLGSFAGTQ